MVWPCYAAVGCFRLDGAPRDSHVGFYEKEALQNALLLSVCALLYSWQLTFPLPAQPTMRSSPGACVSKPCSPCMLHAPAWFGPW